MLPKHKRIKKDSFNPLLASGSVYHTESFLVRTLPSSLTQFAVVVSKKVAPKAVDRNRIRRRIYSLLQKHISRIKKSQSIISAKKGADKLSFQKQEEQIIQLLGKAKLL